MGVIMEPLQIFMELFMLGPSMRVFVEFFVQFCQVMMEPLMGGAAAKQQARQRKGQEGRLLEECPHRRLLLNELL
jgi:hypothetical protein